MACNKLTLRIPTNEDYWSQDSEYNHQVPLIIGRYAEEARQWFGEHYPDVEFDTEETPETFSHPGQYQATGDDAWVLNDAAVAVERWNHYQESRWVDWWREEVELQTMLTNIQRDILDRVAKAYVEKAKLESEIHLVCMIDDSLDGVVYGSDVWSVGSNGDFDDFEDADEAAEALSWSWQGDLDNRLEDGELTRDQVQEIISEAATSIAARA